MILIFLCFIFIFYLYYSYKISFNKNNTIYNLYKSKNTIINVNNISELTYLLNTYKKCRIIGNGWNFNGSCFSDNYTIKLLGDFEKIYNIDLKNNFIRVGAGITLIDLSEYLLKFNKQIKSTGNCIQKNISQTIGGLCSTNVHHTGKNLYPFSETCLLIKVLHYNKNKNIELHIYNSNHPDFYYFFGTIGTLGIITEITLQIEDIKYYKIENIEKTDFIENDIINNGCIIYKPFNLNNLELTKFIILNNNNKNNIKYNVLKNFKEDIFTRFLQDILPFYILNLLYKYSSNNLSKYYKGLYTLGLDSNVYHIETEIYIKQEDLDKIKSSLNNYRDKFIIGIRYIPYIYNSIFTFNSNLYSISFTNITTNKQVNEDLFNNLRKTLKESNIPFYPHFGKYIAKYNYFNTFFDKEIMNKYNNFKLIVDPFNQFISIYN